MSQKQSPASAMQAVNDASGQDTRLYRMVAAQLEALIKQKNLGPGDRLPSERDLAEQLGVSRTSVREAVIVLDLTRVVEVRSGSGIYVSDGAASDLVEAGPGPFEVLAARSMIESEVAATAARMANDKAIDDIMAALNDLERYYDDLEKNELADRNFHLSIARATGNGALVSVVEHLWDQRGRLWTHMEHHFHTEELRAATLADHRRILEAIVARDPVAARRTMRSHLERVKRQFARGWGPVDSAAREREKKTVD
ncbi:MAG: FadR/GntR family transcriptional regulator [Rhizobacter sp.]